MASSTINLIPPIIKKKQQLKQISGILSVTFFTLLIMTAIIYTAIFLANFYTQEELVSAENLLAENEMKIKTLEPLENDVNLINSRLNKVAKLKEDSIVWTDFFELFENSTPTELFIDSLAIDYKAKTITMSGFSESRREIVKLETKLNSMDFLSEVGFSSSSYNADDFNYSFSMAGVFK